MSATQALHDLGQSLWLDNLSRELLASGTLARYIRDFSLTGLTSNPTIFDKAISHTPLYDEAIRHAARTSQSEQDAFFSMALEDVTIAAALFRDVFDATDGADGWVSLEVSPLLAYDTVGTIKQVKELHARAAIPNLFIKIPGTREGVPAIEACLVEGIPINVTLLFSAEQYRAAAGAYVRACQRRLDAGKPPVRSVASLFVSRWDVAVSDQAPARLRNRLGIAVAQRTYRAYRELLASPEWRRLADAGVPAQRLLWGSTGTKDPSASDVFYVEALVAPDTINTMPDATLLAFEDHGKITSVLPADGGDCDAVLDQFEKAGIDTEALSERLQREGADSFVKSWKNLTQRIAAKRLEHADSRAS